MSVKNFMVKQIITALSVLFLFACEEKIPIESVTVEPSSLLMTVGESSVLKATVLPEQADIKTVRWSVTEGNGVVSVDENGKVTALKDGRAVVTAAGIDSEKSGNCTVTVESSIKDKILIAAVESGADPPVDWQKNEDGTVPLTAENRRKMEAVRSLFMVGAGLTNLSAIRYFGGLEELFCADNNLTELPESLPETLIRLECENNRLHSLKVSKLKNLEALKCFSNRLNSLSVSESESLTELYCGMQTDESGKDTDLTLTINNRQTEQWTRWKPIAENKNVFAMIPGTRLEKIEPDQKQIDMKTGEEAVLTVVFFPDYAENKQLTWTVEPRTGIIEISEKAGGGCHITPVGIGLATITATAAEGGYTAQCTVAVAPASGYTFDSKTNTYTVFNEEGLRFWAAKGGGCILVSDIVLAKPAEGESNWTPVSEGYNFNGNGHTIANMTIVGTETDKEVGMFSSAKGVIENLILKDVDIRSSYSSTSDAYIGGIAGIIEAGGRISNCHVTGSLSNSNNSSTAVGGIVGYSLWADIEGCSFIGEINAPDSNYAGGIVGYARTMLNTRNLKGCLFSGKITGGKYIGGISGYGGGYHFIANCANAEMTTQSSEAQTNGISAYQAESITACYWSGNATDGDAESKVDGASLTWSMAADEMNRALGPDFALKFVSTEGNFPELVPR